MYLVRWKWERKCQFQPSLGEPRCHGLVLCALSQKVKSFTLRLVIEYATLFLVSVSAVFPVCTNRQISFATVSFRLETLLDLFLLVAHGIRSRYSELL